MTEPTPIESLSRRLCPWLVPALAKLDRAHGRERLGHAWLLRGTRGIGKINLALVLARRLLDGAATQPAPAALEAAEAASAMRRRHEPADHHPDLHWIHPVEDKTSITVEQIRDATEALALTRFGRGAKVVVVEPAEAMTIAASNALLKTLEEPTPATYLLLVSHQPGRLARTIRSRCQTLLVQGPAAEDGRRWLEALDVPDLHMLGPETMTAPLHVSEFYEDIIDNKINLLESKLNSVYEMKSDPCGLAEQWAKLDLALVLDAIVTLVQCAIKLRATGEHSNSITDRTAHLSHNPWPALTIKQLFRQLDAAQSLRESIGTGINVELGLRVLLAGFQQSRPG